MSKNAEVSSPTSLALQMLSTKLNKDVFDKSKPDDKLQQAIGLLQDLMEEYPALNKIIEDIQNVCEQAREQEETEPPVEGEEDEE